MELGIITLQGMRKAKIRPGDRVAVLGQGLIGQMANRIAHLLGAGSVIAIAPTENRKKTALTAGGADEFRAMKAPGFDASQIQADVVIEAVGTPDAIETAMRFARPGGRVILLGSSRGLSRDVDFATAQAKSLDVVGAHISDMPDKDNSPGRHTYRSEGELFLQLLATRRLQLTDLVTWRAAPDECNAVYEVLARGGREHVAIVFHWRDDPAQPKAGASNGTSSRQAA